MSVRYVHSANGKLLKRAGPWHRATSADLEAMLPLFADKLLHARTTNRESSLHAHHSRSFEIGLSPIHTRYGVGHFIGPGGLWGILSSVSSQITN